jgi:sporulation protein YlmC with PRC-barrel domain
MPTAPAAVSGRAALRRRRAAVGARLAGPALRAVAKAAACQATISKEMQMKMSRWTHTAAVAAAAALCHASWAAGGAQSAPAPQTQRAQPAQPAQTGQHAAGAQRAQTTVRAMDVRASKLIGKKVRNAQGENLGEIHDLMVDVNHQRVHYAVLAFGGFLGLGEKLFAYPVRALQADGDRLVLDVPKERLKDAPGFERNRWPNWGDERYRGEVDRYHGSTVAIEPRSNMRLVRASELLAKDVKDRAGNEAGEIEDLVVDLSTARVRYAVVELDRGWAQSDRMVALPLDAIELPQDRDADAVLRVPRENLNMAAGFDRDRWPDLNDPQYRGMIDQQMPAYRRWTEAASQVMGEPPPAQTPPR